MPRIRRRLIKVLEEDALRTGASLQTVVPSLGFVS